MASSQRLAPTGVDRPSHGRTRRPSRDYPTYSRRILIPPAGGPQGCMPCARARIPKSLIDHKPSRLADGPHGRRPAHSVDWTTTPSSSPTPATGWPSPTTTPTRSCALGRPIRAGRRSPRCFADAIGLRAIGRDTDGAVYGLRAPTAPRRSRTLARCLITWCCQEGHRPWQKSSDFPGC